MFRIFSAIAFFLCLPMAAYAGFNVGGAPGNLCWSSAQAACAWKDQNQGPNCGHAQVNAGQTICNIRIYPGSCTGSSNFSLSACDSTCETGQIRGLDGLCYTAPSCPTGQTRDPESGECVWISSCPTGQQLVTTTNSSGMTTSAWCVAEIQPQEPNCSNSYAALQIPACQQQKNQCQASGGQYGHINGQQVCIPQEYGQQLPTCSSGSMNYVTNSDGSSAFACSTPSSSANPEGETNKSDPNAPADQKQTEAQHAIVETRNAINAGTEAIVNKLEGVRKEIEKQGPNVGGGGGGQPCTGENCQGEGEEPGEEPGNGECDPESSDYAACIGQVEEVGDDAKAGLLGDLGQAGTASLDEIESSMTGALGEDHGFESQPGILTAFVQSILPSAGSCTGLTLSFRGASYTIQCSRFEGFRIWFGWALWLLTVFYCVNVAIRPVQR